MLRLEYLRDDAEKEKSFTAPTSQISNYPRLARRKRNLLCKILDKATETLSSKSPLWAVGFTPEFEKSTKNVDKKLKGRIFDAIQSLTNNPTDLKGDTIKPLTDRYAGLWRYRIGDYRLIYRPDNIIRRITLRAFLPVTLRTQHENR